MAVEHFTALSGDPTQPAKPRPARSSTPAPSGKAGSPWMQFDQRARALAHRASATLVGTGRRHGIGGVPAMAVGAGVGAGAGAGAGTEAGIQSECRICTFFGSADDAATLSWSDRLFRCRFSFLSTNTLVFYVSGMPLCVPCGCS